MARIDVLTGWSLTLAAGWCVFFLFRFRKHHRDHTAFNAYFLVLLTCSTVRLLVYNPRSLRYFWTYWGTEVVILVTFLWMSAALISNQLSPFRTLPRTTVFCSALYASIFTASLVLLMSGVKVNDPTTRIFRIVQGAGYGVALVLLGGTAICSWLLQIHWTKVEKGIVWGVALEWIVDAASMWMMGGMGQNRVATLLARALCLSVWWYSFSSPRPSVRRLTEEEKRQFMAMFRRMGDPRQEENNTEKRGNPRCIC